MSVEYYSNGGLKSAAVNPSASGDNTLLAGVAKQKIYVYAIHLTGGTATDLTLKDGASTTLGGPYKATTLLQEAFHPQRYPLFTVSAGNNLVLNLGAANAFGGTVWYEQG